MRDVGIMGAANGSRGGSHHLGGISTNLGRPAPERIQEQDEPPPDPQERAWPQKKKENGIGRGGGLAITFGRTTWAQWAQAMGA